MGNELPSFRLHEPSFPVLAQDVQAAWYGQIALIRHSVKCVGPFAQFEQGLAGDLADT